jgi:hypothetical protein
MPFVGRSCKFHRPNADKYDRTSPETLMPKPATTLHWITERAARHDVTLLDRFDPDSAAERAALLAGLFATPATISPKYSTMRSGARCSRRSVCCPVSDAQAHHPDRSS